MRSWRHLAALGAVLAIATSASAQSPSTVLVVANANNAQSIALANYYMSARQIPSSNLLLLQWSSTDSADAISQSDYASIIQTPVYSKIKSLKEIDYIVLCRNLPTTITSYGSVDSALAGNINLGAHINPYYLQTAPFTSKKYGMYLVTRLDGWSWDDARALVDRSIAASPGGTIFMDVDPTKTGGYIAWNNELLNTASTVSSADATSKIDTTTTFVKPSYAVAGYASWGSNDAHFNSTNWLGISFLPGAIAETAVSTSAMYLRTKPSGGQSQIAQLIHDGVTGAKGYVMEPYLTAIADPSVLFNRYTTGYNLAESYYAASEYVCWKDVVCGDPLCNPYSGTNTTNASTSPTTTKICVGFSLRAACGAPGDTVDLKTLMIAGGLPVIGRSVQFSVNGTVVGSAVSDSTGATLPWKIPLMAAGLYNVTVSFAGDDQYYSASRTAAALTVTPLRAGVSLSLHDSTGAQGSATTLTTLVYSGGAPLTGKLIQFAVDGTNVGSATSNSSGAAISYNVPASLAIGLHNVTVTFAGDTGYNAATRSATALTVTAPKAGVSFSLRAASGLPGQTVTLRTLVYSGGAPLAGKLIQFSVDGVAAGSATSGSTDAAVSYTIPSTMASGLHNVTVYFAGDNCYYSATRTAAALTAGG